MSVSSVMGAALGSDTHGWGGVITAVGCASGVSSEGGGTKVVEAGTVLVRTNMGLGCRLCVE